MIQQLPSFELAPSLFCGLNLRKGEPGPIRYLAAVLYESWFYE